MESQESSDGLRSHKGVILVFLAMILAIAGIFVWAFVLNKGTLTLQSSLPLHVVIDGEDLVCDHTACSFDLIPARHQVEVSQEGYFSQEFEVQIQRWQEQVVSVDLDFIPQLAVEPVDELIELPGFELRNLGQETLLISAEGEELSRFSRLSTDAQVSEGKNLIALVEDGVVTFVELPSLRRVQMFGDELQVQAVHVHPQGQKVLLFMENEGSSQLMVWDHQQKSLETLSWYEAPEKVAWHPEKMDRIFVLSSDLRLAEERNPFEALLSDLESDDDLRLLQIRYQVSQLDVVHVFLSDEPTALQLLSGQIFLTYEKEGESSYLPLIVSPAALEI